MSRRSITLRKTIVLMAAVLVMLVVERIISHDVLSRASSIEVSVSGEGPAMLRFYYQHPPASRGYDAQRSHAKSLKLEDRKTVSAYLFDNPASLFLISIETQGEPVVVHKVTFHSHYAPVIEITAGDLEAYFKPGDGRTRVEKVEDGLVLISTQAAALESTQPIVFVNRFIQLGFPLLAGILTFLLLRGFDPRRVPSLAQLGTDTDAGSKPHSPELDGLRGLAALSVVADHTWGVFTGSGLVGVWLFFALSGYLLAIPFVRRPEMVFDKGKLQDYFLRRIARIIPMYYTVIFIYYMASGQVQWAIPHILFLQGDGHFWTIPQEMFFYLLLPFVMLVMALLIRVQFKLAVAVLFSLTLWLLLNNDLIPIEINGRPHSRPTYLGWFLCGICASYVLNHDGFFVAASTPRHRIEKLLGVVALVVLVAVFVLGGSTLVSNWLGYRIFPASDYKPYFGLAAAFLVFTAVYARKSAYGAVLRFKPLRSFGIIGYSAYLIHPLLLDILSQFSSFYIGIPMTGFLLFVATTIFTWVVASITYNLIEYPFLARRPVRALESPPYSGSM